MPDGSLSNVQSVFAIETGVDIDILCPEISIGPYMFIDFVYNKSTADPVEITLSLELNNQVSFIIRKVTAYAGLDFYYQLNKLACSGWKFRLTITGATPAMVHKAAMFYR